MTIEEFAKALKKRAYMSSDWSHGAHPDVVEVEDIDDLLQETQGYIEKV